MIVGHKQRRGIVGIVSLAASGTPAERDSIEVRSAF